MKIALTALTLMLLPGLAAAQCMGSYTADRQDMSCSEGSTFDTDAGTCVPIVTG